MRAKAYIYPRTQRTEGLIPNPYIDNFMNSLADTIEFVNKDKPSNIGTLDITSFFSKADFFFFNWIENLPDKKHGIMQSLLFVIIFIPLAKISGKKIIWTLHNKEPHDQKRRRFKLLLFFAMLKYSDYIITHAEEGIEMIKQGNPKKSGKIVYFPHPFSTHNLDTSKKDIDILIWGTMVPYKGVHNFIKLVNEYKTLQTKKIILMGKFKDPQYKKELMSLNHHDIEIHDEYVSPEKLKDHLNRSRIILFTYQQDSVLSSGALCDSIGYGAYVVGPKTGAFKDLEKYGVVFTYNHLNELPDLIDELSTKQSSELQKKQIDFIEKYNWTKVPAYINKIIE